ncbi:MAG: hypothetical protein ACI9Q9_000595 [Flavobacterium sp.]
MFDEFKILSISYCFRNYQPLISNFYFFLMDKNQQQLIKLAHTKMPFGKYEGKFLIDLPEYYVVWYNNKGFPRGELGEQLKLIYELKLNGLEELIRNIKKRYPKPH